MTDDYPIPEYMIYVLLYLISPMKETITTTKPPHHDERK
jgi:hypothetical protein